MIGDLGPTITSYSDKTVKDGKTYWYSVLAVNAVGDGEQATAGKAEMPAVTTPAWLLALIVILVILAIIVLALLLRGPRDMVTDDDVEDSDESSEGDEEEVPDEERAPQETEDKEEE